MPGIDDSHRDDGHGTLIATQRPVLGASPGQMMSAVLSRVIPAATFTSIALA